MSSAGSGDITVAAFDADGGLLDILTAPAVNLSSWRWNFLGLEAEGIRRVTFTGENLALDGLRFEAVPEPSAVLAWGAALAALGAAARRRARAERGKVSKTDLQVSAAAGGPGEGGGPGRL